MVKMDANWYKEWSLHDQGNNIKLNGLIFHPSSQSIPFDVKV
jgi:hypothetical protein